MIRLFHIVIVLLMAMGLTLVGVRAEVVCNFSDRSKMVTMDGTQFFAGDPGSLAIGEDCNLSTNLCRSYLDVSKCTAVTYGLEPNSKQNPVYFAVNNVTDCTGADGDCEINDTFLSAAFLFTEGDADTAIKPFVDAYRNRSQDWRARGALSEETCCDVLLKAEQFLALLAGDNEKEVSRLLGGPWQNSFDHPTRHGISTWDQRGFFIEALGSCNLCSMKAFLIKFKESPRGDGTDVPGRPLLFGGKTLTFDGLELRMSAPFADDIYDHTLPIKLVR